jgi:hypothetical protein
MPAARKGGRAFALAARVGRFGIPIRALVAASRSVDDPQLDDLARAAAERWPDRIAGQPRCLSLERAAARTIFVFGEEAERPSVVLKLADATNEARLINEMNALKAAESAQVAPLFLGRFDNVFAQEALPGEPLEPPAITASSAGRLEWTRRNAALAEGLSRLAAATVTPEPPSDLVDGVIDRAIGYPYLSTVMRTELSDAMDSLGDLRVSVLKHGDTSGQNALFEGDRFAGLVDWEFANPTGSPGFDTLNSAMAHLEHGLAVRRWSHRLAGEAFERAWTGTFFSEARAAARSAVAAAGLGEDVSHALEIAFFARRLGHRVGYPDDYATGPRVAANALEVVCAGRSGLARGSAAE